MHTLIHDAETTNMTVFYADRLIRLVVDHDLEHQPFCRKAGDHANWFCVYECDFSKRLCGASVIRYCIICSKHLKMLKCVF
ncbi:hypothetical protein LguiA_035726 [Lonicera macranthoides]